MSFHIGSGRSHRTPVNARIKYAPNGGPIRAVCGRAQECPGSLGTFTIRDDDERIWHVRHPDGYREVAHGWWAVLKPEQDRRRGYRRPMVWGQGMPSEWATLGRAPMVPGYITCARCLTPNWIGPSEEDDWWPPVD